MSKEEEQIKELEAELASYRKAMDQAYKAYQEQRLALIMCCKQLALLAYGSKLPSETFRAAFWVRTARKSIKASERLLDEIFMNGDGAQRPLGLLDMRSSKGEERKP